MGSSEIPLTTIPPRRFRFTRWANSTPYPKVPLAAMMGLARRSAPTFTERSTAAGAVTAKILAWPVEAARADCGKEGAIPARRHIFDCELSTIPGNGSVGFWRGRKTCPPQERAASTKSTPPNEDDLVAASPSRVLRGGEGRLLFKLSTTAIPQGSSRPADRMLGYSANAHRRKIAIDDGDRN